MMEENVKPEYKDYYPIAVLKLALLRMPMTMKYFSEVGRFPVSSVMSWKKKHPDFNQAFIDGKKISELIAKAVYSTFIAMDAHSFKKLTKEEKIEIYDEMMDDFKECYLQRLMIEEKYDHEIASESDRT